MSFVLNKVVATPATTGCPTALAVPDNYVSPFHTDPVSKGTWLDGAVWVDWPSSLAGPSQGGGTIASTTILCAYRKFGKSCKFQGSLTITGSGIALNGIQMQVPFAGRQFTNLRVIGSAIIYDQSANAYWKGVVVPVGPSSVQFVNMADQAANFLGASGFTAALTNLDTISWDMEYEIA